MARARSPNIDKAFEIYKENNGNIELVKIAEILGVSNGTVRSWKNRYKWDENINTTLHKKECNVAMKKDKKVNKKKIERKPIEKEVKEVLENAELTDKQRLFCLYYIKCFNATKAYQKAYECDYLIANVNGSRLLVNASVEKEIYKLKEYRKNKCFLQQEDIIQKYIDIAFADINDYVVYGKGKVPIILDDGTTIEAEQNYLNFKNSSDVDGTLISEIKQGKGGVSIKLIDKMKALDFLSKHYDLLSNDNKEKLEIEKRKLENYKLKAEISRITGEHEDKDTEDDGFINALNGSAQEDWENEEE